jgi:MFS transporter, DHA2 family, multidrug resistance protein
MNSYVPYGDLKGGRLMLAAFVLALANFMVVLDMTIANVSVPHITGSLAVSSSQGTWVITSYAVAEAICVPLTGWLAGRFGGVRVFTLSLIGFTIFSVFCGLSTSLEMLTFLHWHYRKSCRALLCHFSLFHYQTWHCHRYCRMKWHLPQV